MSLGNVSRVVVDETIIEGEAEPHILYENLQQAVGASDNSGNSCNMRARLRL
jgi:hypothetical protein